jgi:mannose-1-phosphate guanylyltransferase
MKAFLLAAGNGTRLRPLTDALPKCLLPVQGVPLLNIWLNICEAAGIDDVLVNVHAHKDKICEFARRENSNGNRVRLRIAEEKELLGSAGTLAENKSFVDGEEDFCILYGDVLTNVNLSGLIQCHREKKQIVTLGIHQVANPTQCGIVSADANGIVQGFVEKPEHPEGNWAFSGVMVASSLIFAYAPQQRPADIGFHLLPRLIGKMAAYEISAFLLDIGTLNNYNAAQTSWPGLG